MAFKDFTAKVGTQANKIGFAIKKASPEILVVAGVVGIATSTVMACIATTKAGEIRDEFDQNMSDIHEITELVNSGKISKEKYTEEDVKKDTVIAYSKAVAKYIKLYAPAFLVGSLSIACIVGSHNILSKRNAALAAAYATVDKGFKQYRNRVAERFGEEVEKEIRYNVKAEEFKETVTDENGKKRTKKTKVKTVDEGEFAYSGYARIFDENSQYYQRDAEDNLGFIKKQEAWANYKLKEDGYLFLNDVYSMLGLPKTKAGQVVGWIYDEENPEGDNYVDFGLYDVNKRGSRNFVNGYERAIVLDFNVDGDILHHFF